MSKPHERGQCPGWWPSPKWISLQCYPCWKNKNKATRRKRNRNITIGFEVKAIRRKSDRAGIQFQKRRLCIHLGVLLEKRPCSPGGRDRDVYACEFGDNEATRCTIEKNCGKDRDIASCARCKYYEPMTEQPVPAESSLGVL